MGTIPNATVGMEYKLTGHWEESKFGLQFSFDLYHLIEPTDARGIFNYIVRVCKFVGSAVGNAILDQHGDKSLEIMKESPELISEIKGITRARAIEIQATLLMNAEYEAVIVKLEAILDVPGMRKSLLNDLLKKYKHEAADRVLENPYMVIQFPGVGFSMADKVAIINADWPRDSIERKKAATIHAMNGFNLDGHVWVDKKELVSAVYELIQIKNLGQGAQALIDDSVFVQDGDDMAFSYMAEEEDLVAEVLINLERMSTI